VEDGTGALSGARYGAIYAPAVPHSPLDFVTSGLTPEEHGTLARGPTASRLFEGPLGLVTPRRLAGLGGLRHSPAEARV